MCDELCLAAGEFYGFHGSRSSQLHPDDNGVQEICYVPSFYVNDLLLILTNNFKKKKFKFLGFVFLCFLDMIFQFDPPVGFDSQW